MSILARLGIVVATESEAVWARRRLVVQTRTVSPVGALWQGQLLGLDVALIRCGMGPARAALALEWLVSQGPLWGLLSIGFAGGLQPQLATGDSVIASAIRSAELLDAVELPEVFPHESWKPLLTAAATQARLVSHQGVLLSSTSIIQLAIDKQELGLRSGAVAIDMESHRLGCEAAAHRLPFSSLRTIFDTSHDNLTLPAETFTTADGRLQLGRLLGYVGRHPRSMAQFPSLWRKARVAGQHLDAWLAHFLTLLHQPRSE